jgi:superfamily I DNA and/or RNA helicase
VVIARVKHLRQLLSNYPHPEGGTWTVAVLTFYRGQERELRDRLRKLTKQNRSPYKFGSLSINLCTTDRFQGHEADVVILSYVRTRSAGFLDSPNRLNVAITRARYQMIHVGKRSFFQRSYIKKKARLLHDLVESLPQEAFVTDIAKKRRKRS